MNTQAALALFTFFDDVLFGRRSLWITRVKEEVGRQDGGNGEGAKGHYLSGPGALSSSLGIESWDPRPELSNFPAHGPSLLLLLP